MAMACQAIYRWTLVGLVGAFLDLVIAYCLLCAAAIAFMISKFLGIFGFRFRCLCSGVFGVDSSRILCFQRLLAEYPTEKVSNVQLSVRSKFPFNDFGWEKEQISDTKFRLTGSKERDVVEFEGEGSSGSLLSDARKSNSIVSVFSGREGRFDLKGKGIMHQRSRSGVRRRQKGGFGKSLSVASLQVQGFSSSPISYKGRNQWVEDDMELQQYGRDRHQFNYTEETPPIIQRGHRSSNGLELREFADSGDEQVKELKGNGQLGLDLSTEAENTIILLEQALREEHAASADLYLELEKERSAAASAADEAMAMIQRLQEEKAAVEMEARQYQRMIEEKSAYDAEEMNILKEIIVRRETEKHFLEKQLEAYRESSNLGNEHSSGAGADTLDQLQPCFDYSFNTDDDPVHLLHQLSSNFDKKVMLETQKQDNVMSGDEGGIQLATAKEILSQKSDDEFREFQDKLISVDSNSYAAADSLQNSESFYQSLAGDNSGDISQEEVTILSGSTLEGRDNINISPEIAKRNVETSASPYSDVFLNQRKHDSDLGTQTSCNVHDLYVVNQGNLSNHEKEIELDFVSERTSEILGNSSAPSEPPAVRKESISNNCRISCSSDREVNIKRSASDITRGLPPICPKGKSTVSELLHKSLSGVDNERWRIDHEVGWLQERLREIQERREKLNISMVHREKDNMQFKLLENIANQLQEIRQLTEPKKAARQSSLPPPSSKGISKKRRCRSVTHSLQAGSSANTDLTGAKFSLLHSSSGEDC